MDDADRDTLMRMAAFAQGDGARTALCAARGQAEAASSVVPRGRHHRLQRSLCVVGIARTPVARCRPHRRGQGRAIRPAGGSERHPALKNPSRCVRRPSDRY
jgi:hypothetical protein